VASLEEAPPSDRISPRHRLSVAIELGWFAHCPDQLKEMFKTSRLHWPDEEETRPTARITHNSSSPRAERSDISTPMQTVLIEWMLESHNRNLSPFGCLPRQIQVICALRLVDAISGVFDNHNPCY
jgi:hypothetical protein